MRLVNLNMFSLRIDINDSLPLSGIYAQVYEFIMLTHCSSTDIKSLKRSLRLLFALALQRDQREPNSWLASDVRSVNYINVQMANQLWDKPT